MSRPLGDKNAALLGRLRALDDGGSFFVKNCTQTSLMSFRDLCGRMGYGIMIKRKGNGLEVTRMVDRDRGSPGGSL